MVNKTLIVNHVYGKDDTSFWENFDYDKSIKAGMEYAELPLQRQIWLYRNAYELVHHAHGCTEGRCGEVRRGLARNPDNRLAEIKDIYIPGKTTIRLLTPWAGWLLQDPSVRGIPRDCPIYQPSP